jgi:hypothetical protein
MTQLGFEEENDDSEIFPIQSGPPRMIPKLGNTDRNAPTYIGASLLPSTSPEKARVIGMLVDCRLAVPNRSHSVRAALGTNFNSSPIL